MFNWPFEDSATLYVQGSSYWLGWAGFAFSIVGFFITWFQLYRTKRATTAVSAEIKNIKLSVSRYNATTETSRAETALSTARKHVKSLEWDQANDALDAYSKAMHTLRELSVAELEAHEPNIENAMNFANRLCERLDSSRSAGLPKNEIAKTLATLREHDKLITSVRVVLDRRNIGE